MPFGTQPIPPPRRNNNPILPPDPPTDVLADLPAVWVSHPVLSTHLYNFIILAVTRCARPWGAGSFDRVYRQFMENIAGEGRVALGRFMKELRMVGMVSWLTRGHRRGLVGLRREGWVDERFVQSLVRRSVRTILKNT